LDVTDAVIAGGGIGDLAAEDATALARCRSESPARVPKAGRRHPWTVTNQRRSLGNNDFYHPPVHPKQVARDEALQSPAPNPGWQASV
jgi:hypothetical protein